MRRFDVASDFRAKDHAGSGDTSLNVLTRALTCSALAVTLMATTHADACPAVTLDGDAELVEKVRTQLASRGVTTHPQENCPPAKVARVERGAPVIVVTVDDVAREVLEPGTAATVIESFASDPSAPLLAARTIRPAPPPAVSDEEPSVSASAVRPSARGLHVFAGMDSAIASDKTGWLGLQTGLCVMAGPVCIAGRYRSSVGITDDAKTQSQSQEALVGVDVPFTLGERGTWWLIPGVGLGKSWLQVHTPDSYLSSDVVRAEAHATLSMPLTSRFGLDFSVAASLVQRVHDDHRMGDTPGEAWGLARVGVALRYGAR